MNYKSLRGAIFMLGFAALVSSFVTFAIGVTRARHFEGYLVQADAVAPLLTLQIEFGSAAFIFFLFGKGKVRIASILVAGIYLLYCFLLAESLY